MRLVSCVYMCACVFIYLCMYIKGEVGSSETFKVQANKLRIRGSALHTVLGLNTACKGICPFPYKHLESSECPSPEDVVLPWISMTVL